MGHAVVRLKHLWVLYSYQRILSKIVPLFQKSVWDGKNKFALFIHKYYLGIHGICRNFLKYFFTGINFIYMCQVTLQKYHQEVYQHIKYTNQMYNTSEAAVKAVKEG